MDSSPLGPSTSGGMNPEHVGRVRVLVIGNTGCGKTSLSHFLATGEVLKAAQTTVGCNVFAKLVEYPEDTSVDGTKQNHRLYFVELWDVGAHPRYSHLRKLFYDQVNGVLLVHDVSVPSSRTSLTKWASEVASGSTFVAPLPEEVASENIGRLPVPVLVVGNKVDVRQGGSIANCSRWAWWLSLLSWLWPSVSWRHFPLLNAPSLTKDDSDWGITGSALKGTIDQVAVEDFFFKLIERRYYANTKGGFGSPRGWRFLAKPHSQLVRDGDEGIRNRLDADEYL